ncbi:RHS repeat-associated core domain-containing protein [Halomonas sp. MMSF_3323]|uniref:RHS repeat-associated core domain-containing protein n=1 Tax=Halomonas sp. MMSF_3323 TaxID=3046701 RepID=UPI00273FD32F|nr:RHS repeat-associated core domain-containing protein [Halomonas sp. MMSF_3323]
MGHYRAWGKLTKASDGHGNPSTTDNPLRFQGQYLDEETGLHYNRHRYYDPETGRFTTHDPIGLAGGENLYMYAPNPTGWVDPLGLAKGTNERGQITSRTSWRKSTVRATWENANEGPSGGRLCPKCGVEVNVAPETGPRDWHIEHDPTPWSNRDFPDDVTRPQVIENYQEGVILKCPRCNMSEGNRK